LQWTPSGDAFVIGSDLKRLEEETLPLYFRHNRFQSLVRQLNFYSFRKVNRERNVWIYKHELFHRDHPDDLHLVRRRTCPGLDGRKQRFSRFAIRRASSTSSLKSDENSQNEVISPQEYPALISRTPSMSRRTPIWDASSARKGDAMVVDTSMVQPEPADGDAGEDQGSVTAGKKDPKAEMAQQSMVVSEVAMKLEECARRATQGRSGGRRSGTGIITPPYGSTPRFGESFSDGLLTYDDEYTSMYETDEDKFGTQSPESNRSIASVSLDSMDEAPMVTPVVTPTKPVEDRKVVEEIVQRILSSPEHPRGTFAALAILAGFCMSTSPSGDDLCSKILQLISSCDKLGAEFSQYRSALHPLEYGEMCATFALSPDQQRGGAPTTVQQEVWERSTYRHDYVRDFTTFAVNSISKALGKSDGSALSSLSENDMLALERTANIWQKSV
jgi:hypothetical protein